MQVHGSEGADEAEAKVRVARGEAPQDEAVRAAKAAPWTGFNNCTARLSGRLRAALSELRPGALAWTRHRLRQAGATA